MYRFSLGALRHREHGAVAQGTRAGKPSSLVAPDWRNIFFIATIIQLIYNILYYILRDRYGLPGAIRQCIAVCVPCSDAEHKDTCSSVFHFGTRNTRNTQVGCCPRHVLKIYRKNVGEKFAGSEKKLYLCSAFSKRALSSAGSERLPYKQRVGGSNPSAPTGHPAAAGWLFFILPA